MRLHRVVSVLAVLSAACNKGTPPEIPKVDAPADVIATLSLGHAAAFATRLGRYLEQVTPGAGAQMNGKALADLMTKMVGAPKLDGVDLDQPVRLIIFNPKIHKEHPVILLGSFPDAEKLRRGIGSFAIERKEGRALVGAEPEVTAAKAWALGPLADAPVTDAPTVEIWTDRVMAAFRPDLEALPKSLGALGMTGAVATVLEGEIKLLIAGGEQSERMTMVFDTNGDDAYFDMALVPRAGTAMARFIGGQKPFDVKLLGAVPGADSAAMVMVGHIELGELGEAFYKIGGPLMAEMTGRPFDEAFHTGWNGWLAHFTGDFAATAGLENGGGTTMNEVLGVDDGPAAQKAMVAFFGSSTGSHQANVMGLGMTLTLSPAAAQHGAASIDTFVTKLDTSTMPEMQRAMMNKMYPNGMNMAMAGYGKLLGVTLGSQSVERVGQLIDLGGAGGKVSVSPYTQLVLDEAKKRKDSMLLVMNMAAFMNPAGPPVPAQSGMAMSASFADKSAHVRMSLPVKHVLEMVAAIKSSTQFQH